MQFNKLLAVLRMWKKLALVVVLSFFGFCTFVWSDADPIERAAISSELVLLVAPIRGYETTASWFDKYRGEAPGHQSMISVVAWCIRNESSSKLLLEKFSPDVLDRLNWAAKDSGQFEGWNRVTRNMENEGDC